MTSIKLLYVSARECHPQGVFQIKGLQALLEKLTGFQLINKLPAFYGAPNVHYRIHKCMSKILIF